MLTSSHSFYFGCSSLEHDREKQTAMWYFNILDSGLFLATIYTASFTESSCYSGKWGNQNWKRRFQTQSDLNVNIQSTGLEATLAPSDMWTNTRLNGFFCFTKLETFVESVMSVKTSAKQSHFKWSADDSTKPLKALRSHTGVFSYSGWLDLLSGESNPLKDSYKCKLSLGSFSHCILYCSVIKNFRRKVCKIIPKMFDKSLDFKPLSCVLGLNSALILKPSVFKLFDVLAFCTRRCISYVPWKNLSIKCCWARVGQIMLIITDQIFDLCFVIQITVMISPLISWPLLWLQ